MQDCSPTIHLYPKTELPHYPGSPPSKKNIKIITKGGGNKLCEIYVNDWELPHYPPMGYPTIHGACSISREKRG